MSMLKFANGKNRGTDAIRKSIAYILNPGKTNSSLIAINGVSVDSPAEDIETVQLLLGKNTGRRYIHMIISFDRNVSVTTAYDVACSAAEYFAENYQYVLAMHTNTANVHAHIVLSAVNIRTGKKFSQSRKEMLAFREHVNFCLRQFGLDEIGKNAMSKIHANAQDYIDSFWDNDDFEDDFFDDFDDDTDDFAPYRSFFGPYAPEEAEAISMAEEADRLRKSAYEYFEGKSSDFPDEIPSCDVDVLYDDWLEAERREREEREEEEESYRSFFNRFPGHLAH